MVVVTGVVVVFDFIRRLKIIGASFEDFSVVDRNRERERVLELTSVVVEGVVEVIL